LCAVDGDLAGSSGFGIRDEVVSGVARFRVVGDGLRAAASKTAKIALYPQGRRLLPKLQMDSHHEYPSDPYKEKYK
jgi:hypothetical protein